MPKDSRFQLRIASPCKAPWEDMRGDARVRFCEECQQSVYNLTEMAESEARRLVAEAEGRLCVRFYRRRDGTVLTSDCAIGQKRAWLRAAGRAVAAMTVLAAGVGTLSGCADDYDGQQGYDDEEPVQMGEALMGSLPIHDGGDEDAGDTGGSAEIEEIMGKVVLPTGDSPHEE